MTTHTITHRRDLSSLLYTIECREQDWPHKANEETMMLQAGKTYLVNHNPKREDEKWESLLLLL